MKYNIVFKFLAVFLCAAMLLGAVASGVAIFAMVEMGLYDRTYWEAYEEYLEERSSDFAYNMAMRYASENLGGASRQMVDARYGTFWHSDIFRWGSYGYTLKDSTGKVLEYQTMDEGMEAAYTFQIPVGGNYTRVISTMTEEEYRQQQEQPTEPANRGAQVLVMPTQESTPILWVALDYTDGSRTEYQTGEELGVLYFSDSGELILRSNEIGEIAMGDGWYVNHIVLADMGGNVVYEAQDDAYVLSGMSMEGNDLLLHLPVGTLTTAAPVGITFTDGDFTSYDAIPTAGTTVASLNVTYGNVEGGGLASEGVSSPDLIGTIFHDSNGNAQFRSTDPMQMDVPENAVITHISFWDVQENLIYEASCPHGVGHIEYDEKGYLLFRASGLQDTGAEDMPAVEATTGEEAPSQEATGTVTETANIRSAPHSTGELLGTLEAGTEVVILRVEQVNGVYWGLMTEGWIEMAYVQLAAATEETVPEEGISQEVTGTVTETVNIRPVPNVGGASLGVLEAGAEVVILRQEAVNGVQWGLMDKGWIQMAYVQLVPVPQETAAAETIPEETASDVMTLSEEPAQAAAEPTMATEPAMAEAEATAETVPAEDIHIFGYYDNEIGAHMVAQYTSEPMPEYVMEVQLAAGATDQDYSWQLIGLAYNFRDQLLPSLGICLLLFAISGVYLCCAAGRKPKTTEVRAGGLNRIPLDAYLAGGGVLAMGLVAMGVEVGEYLLRENLMIGYSFLAAMGFLCSLLVVGFCFAFVAQIKTPGGYWWRNSLCGRCLNLAVIGSRYLLKSCGWLSRNGEEKLLPLLKRIFRAIWKLMRFFWELLVKGFLWTIDIAERVFEWIGRNVMKFYSLLPVTWQWLLTGFAMTMMLYIALRSYKVGWILLGFGVFFGIILYGSSAFGILLESAKRMSKGDLDTKVDDKVLIGSFKEFAGELNDLADVAVVAAQKQLKSERMKTELITNVSHDIKTPLTSIINYVDLLEKPHTPEEQEVYLEVLSRQSQRLKKLIDDLMEMSKASTGNMTVDIEVVNAAEAINQSLGEFADKLERAQLTPVFRQPEDTVYMLADGRLVWRVMSNLLGNAVKYALPGTRLYVDLAEADGRVIISLKNISRESLNVHADELLERFVRGDASRNTEGSGLGLNIAQSLMELQKGQLQLLVDGDLFKVTLIFPGA